MNRGRVGRWNWGSYTQCKESPNKLSNKRIFIQSQRFHSIRECRSKKTICPFTNDTMWYIHKTFQSFILLGLNRKTFAMNVGAKEVTKRNVQFGKDFPVVGEEIKGMENGIHLNQCQMESHSSPFFYIFLLPRPRNRWGCELDGRDPISDHIFVASFLFQYIMCFPFLNLLEPVTASFSKLHIRPPRKTKRRGA